MFVLRFQGEKIPVFKKNYFSPEFETTRGYLESGVLSVFCPWVGEQLTSFISPRFYEVNDGIDRTSYNRIGCVQQAWYQLYIWPSVDRIWVGIVLR